MDQLAYLVIRLGIGASMLGHGIVRMPKLKSFSDWMVIQFDGSMIPSVLVLPFSYMVPFIEFFLGIALVLGFRTRVAGFVGALLMCTLIFGSCLIEKWAILPSQMIHLAFFSILIHFSSGEAYKISVK